MYTRSLLIKNLRRNFCPKILEIAVALISLFLTVQLVDGPELAWHRLIWTLVYSTIIGFVPIPLPNHQTAQSLCSEKHFIAAAIFLNKLLGFQFAELSYLDTTTLLNVVGEFILASSVLRQTSSLTNLLIDGPELARHRYFGHWCIRLSLVSFRFLCRITRLWVQQPQWKISCCNCCLLIWQSIAFCLCSRWTTSDSWFTVHQYYVKTPVWLIVLAWVGFFCGWI
jgi:hypothetical protein